MQYFVFFSGFFVGIAVIVALGLLWLHYIPLHSFGDEIHFVPTHDNMVITLYHYKPEKNNGHEPIVLCHGITSNHYTFDLGNENGLAVWLKSQGYDVWSLELRGRLFQSPRALSARQYKWSFSDYVRYDAPAAIDFVLDKTYSKQLTWIGHSMGGMIGYSLAMHSYAEKLNCMVVIGSPAGFEGMKHLQKLAQWYNKLYNYAMLPSGLALKILAPLAALVGHEKISLVLNPKNLSFIDRLRFYGNAVNNISATVLKEMALSVQKGNFSTMDDYVNFGRDFHKINLPMLYVAGSVDNLVPADHVYWGFQRCHSQHKKWILAGRSSGMTYDLGHNDMVACEAARMQLYPKIIEFIVDHNKVKEIEMKISNENEKSQKEKKSRKKNEQQTLFSRVYRLFNRL